MPGLLLLCCLLCIVPASSAPAADAPGLIGGVGLTHLTVYEQRPAPDGLDSGCPHTHAVTDEAYYILSGTGRAELHDLKHGMCVVELKAGQYLQFPPCTLHRIISTGKLIILALMGNAGLAERGDARIYFGKAVDDDPKEYARLWGLAKEKGLEGALDRRDAAVRAYGRLLELWSADRPAYFADLRRFIDVHQRAMKEIAPKLSEAVASGPLAWGKFSQQRLDALPLGDATPLPAFHDPGESVAYGMCGVLRPVTGLKTVNPE